MDQPQSKVAAFFARPRVLLDGGVGTELKRRGVATPAPLWSAAATETAPDTLRAIHAEFVTAAADVIFANTFRVNAGILARINRDSDGPRLTQTAVAIAREAAQPDREILIAASLGPVADCYRPAETPNDESLREAHNKTAAWLATAKPDLVWLETMSTTREARIAAAAVHANGLPLAVSFILNEAGELLGGDPLADAVAAIREFAPVAIGLNCMPPTGITRHLPALSDIVGSVPIAAYAHVDNRTPLPGWSFAENAEPTEYAAFAANWRRLGATIIGGCCGTTPAHIAVLRDNLA